MDNQLDWETFIKKLDTKSGINLRDYKPAQMQRRITNLMVRHGVDTYMAFYAMFERDEKLYRDFINYLTINVTEFFRTPEKFAELESKVLPDLLAKSPRLNIWSAGCSTGAEPYSLAMILRDATFGAKHRILATDLDAQMLIKAQNGRYAATDIKAMSAGRLEKYFNLGAGDYIVKDEIKQMIEFQKHNLLADRFESGFDLILCRNVVIYFTEEAKDALYRKFFAALKPGGVLFVGGTEAILNFRDIGFGHYMPFFYRKP